MTNHPLPLILASQSPRRKMLLEQIGYQFTVDAPDDSVEKGICTDCSPEDLVLEAAFLKARAIAGQSGKLGECLILAADTVAECQGQVLGKPLDRDHAERMLRHVSGKQHRVLTGVCFWHLPSGQYLAKLEQTVLRMDVLTEAMLGAILDSDMWVGKAGAFGYQDGLDWVHIENGLESNVVGLPVERLDSWQAELLQKVNATR